MNEDLTRIAKEIENFDPEERNYVSKEVLQADYERMKEVYDTLTCTEMKFLWYIRHGGHPHIIYGLLNNARNHYDAIQVVLENRREMLLTAKNGS